MAVFRSAAGTAFRAEVFHLDFAQVATSDAFTQLFNDGSSTAQMYLSFADPVTHAYTANVTTTPPITLSYSSLNDPLTGTFYAETLQSSYTGLTSDFAFYDYSSGSAVLVGTATGMGYDLSEDYSYQRVQTETAEISRTHTVTAFSGLFMGDDRVTLGGLDDYFCDPSGDLTMHLGGGNDLGIHLPGSPDDVVTMWGDAGNDRLSVQGGTGALYGGLGRDSITSFDGASYDIYGGAGGDQVYAYDGVIHDAAGSGSDDYAGNGSGLLVLSYAGATAGITADLWTGYARSAEIGQDSVGGIRHLVGGLGDDRLIGNPFGMLSEFGVTLEGNSGNDTITGSSRADILWGDAGDDRLVGYEGADAINGGAGNDRLYGDGVIGVSGDDTLTGGVGRDLMTGNDGADVFVFLAADSTLAAPDRITDFAPGVDRIDLHLIDARPGTPVDDRFTFIADAAFGRIGQLRVFQSGGDTVIETNVTGDLAADWRLVLTGLLVLDAGDFIR